MYVSVPDCFMIAFITGFLFGLVYEALRIVRLIFRLRLVVVVCDIAFFVLAGAAVCELSKILGNYVRVYTVLGFGAGVFTYIVTIGRLFNVIESGASVIWRKTLGKLFHKTARIAHLFIDNITQSVKLFIGKVHENMPKPQKNPIFGLKSRDKIVYNNNSSYTDRDIDENIGGSEKAHAIKAKITKSSREYP